MILEPCHLKLKFTKSFRMQRFDSLSNCMERNGTVALFEALFQPGDRTQDLYHALIECSTGMNSFGRC